MTVRRPKSTKAAARLEQTLLRLEAANGWSDFSVNLLRANLLDAVGDGWGALSLRLRVAGTVIHYQVVHRPTGLRLNGDGSRLSDVRRCLNQSRAVDGVVPVSPHAFHGPYDAVCATLTAVGLTMMARGTHLSAAYGIVYLIPLAEFDVVTSRVTRVPVDTGPFDERPAVFV